ncbi:hypothetical protein MKX42_17955 [Paenibacillus sp. FSL R7-0204]|uniref:hypothetical protein n=1 Tax=Paenibacillus sp. FSL R7-0204 TaxID=2921675 RepID=UPI0030FBD349
MKISIQQRKESVSSIERVPVSSGMRFLLEQETALLKEKLTGSREVLPERLIRIGPEAGCTVMNCWIHGGIWLQE